MYGRGVNGANGSSRGGRKHAGSAKRRNGGATKAQQNAARKFLAESGVEIRAEDVEAAIQLLRR